MKKWENPELNVLGLANTKEEGIETADEKWLLRKCPYCGKLYNTILDPDHEKKCNKNPANPPASEGTGPEGLPTPALS